MRTLRPGVAVAVLATATSFFPCAAAGDAFLVRDGQPLAQIVISETPQRSARLAAQEFQDGIAKISGARLPIVTQPDAGVPVQVYVGRSSHTDRLGITAEGLKDGAYRIVSGATWLALIGDDTGIRGTGIRGTQGYSGDAGLISGSACTFVNVRTENA